MSYEFLEVGAPASVTAPEWHDWKWQFRNALESQEDFAEHFDLSEAEKVAFSHCPKTFSARTTPYYARLCEKQYGRRGENPLRWMLMPHGLELSDPKQALLDPLGERKHSPVPRVIHRYPDRVLLFVTDQCGVYCRHCLRKHFTATDQAGIKPRELDLALDYIRAHRSIREVIFSGGDALALSDEKLLGLVARVREIRHVDVLRLATRMPVVCPMRVTSTLVERLREFHPIFVMTHFNHPKELTRESAEALLTFVNQGFPVMNQVVLLNGVNNHPAVIEALHRRLLTLRVKPYYMFQCDPSPGTDHFRTSIEESLALQRELWGRLSGLAMAPLSLDIPGGGGKVGLVPDFETSRSSDSRSYRGWDGIEGTYLNPDPALHREPLDFREYLTYAFINSGV